MNKKGIKIIVCLVTVLMGACAPSQEAIQAAIAQTQSALALLQTQNPLPTSTPYPTYTPRPPIYVTRVFIETPTNQQSNDACKPITTMYYTDNSKVAILLQAYVAGLPGVKAVSLVYPERLYPNSISESFHVNYTDASDGKTYSKRYIVYMSEFGWKNAVFSIDGQCWIDPPH
jgi:hypothetical protein